MKILSILGKIVAVITLYFCLFCGCCLDSENWIPFFIGFVVSAAILFLYALYVMDGGIKWEED